MRMVPAIQKTIYTIINTTTILIPVNIMCPNETVSIHRQKFIISMYAVIINSMTYTSTSVIYDYEACPINYKSQKNIRL